MATKQQRFFNFGEYVKVKKKSRVIDRQRGQEGVFNDEDRAPIDQDVTGVEGEICGSSYASSTKDGEVCTPIKTKGGAVIGVPENRLEPVKTSPSKAGYSRAYELGWERGMRAAKKAKRRRKE